VLLIPFEIVALVPSFLFSFSSIMSRRGLDGSTPHTGSFIVLIVNFLAFSLALVIVDFSRIVFSWHWIAFMAAGVSSPALSLFFLYRSISRFGVASTNALVNSHVLFGPILAIFILGERPHPGIWFGIALLLAGVWFLMGGGELRKELRNIWIPLMSALAFAMAHNLRKIGFGGMDSLLFAGFLQGVSAVLIGPFILKLATGGQAYVFNRKSVLFFLVAGLAMSIAFFALLFALRGGRVSLIGPIMATGPLFAILQTKFFLGGREKLTPRIICAACIIVIGVVVVSSLE
jgi:drug/metabolite transporter (DMT)-like permease